MNYFIEAAFKTIFALDVFVFGRSYSMEVTEPNCGFCVMDEMGEVVKYGFTTRSEAESYCQDMGYTIGEY